LLPQKRPPNWEREELILALDLYFSLTPNQFEETNPRIIELSALLNKMADFLNHTKSEKYRNTVSVKSKLNNLLFLDIGKGRPNIGNNDRKIWTEFSKNREGLRKEADRIRLGIVNDFNDDPGLKLFLPNADPEASEFPEGRIRYFMHKKRERNSKIIVDLKKNADKSGKLFCEVCGFDFFRTYGNTGKGFIECHHLKPLSEYVPNEKTTKENLVLICSNCHKMLHKYRPWLARDELKTILKSTN
jgi:5-methylcytosine-specific restriction enzyme A